MIQQSPEHSDVYDDMVVFTRLQRFFRVALDGPLSESFPLEELPVIAEATLGSVNTSAPTLRWNTRAGQIEANLQGLLSEAPDLSGPVRACIALAGQPDANLIAPAEWNATCGPGLIKAGLDPEDSRFVDYLSELRGIRFDLGLSRDAILAKSYAASGCPKP